MKSELDLECEAEFGVAAGLAHMKTHEKPDLFPRAAQPEDRNSSPLGIEQLHQAGISLRLDKNHILVIQDSVHQIHRQKFHLEGTQGIVRPGEIETTLVGCISLQKPIEQDSKEQETDDDGLPCREGQNVLEVVKERSTVDETM